MNRFEKRRLKQKIYRHMNAITYIGIFVLASIITIVAAVGRNDDVSFVDESKLSVTATESIGIGNGESVKVAATENKTTETITVNEETTVLETTKNQVKVIADTLVVRSEQSQESEALGTVSENDTLDVINVYGDWVQIDFEGNTGYVNALYVEFIE